MGINPSMVTQSFWQDKRVLITGHTGFKGLWLSLWLERLGADVSGVSLLPETSPNLYELSHFHKANQSTICDIRNLKDLSEACKLHNPEIVFHLAAQPLVRESYIKPIETFDSNVMGTANLLESLRELQELQSVVLITTDKVYKDNGLQKPYSESDHLGGHDPYSASKAACEIIIDSYRKSFFNELNIPIASARAGNVIGGGDWSKDRLIPDAIKAWNANEILEIRRPNSTRPWQHVLEPLNGYIDLAEKIIITPEKAQAYNFGPANQSHASVQEVIEIARKYYGKGEVSFQKIKQGPHEADWLSLNIQKASIELGFEPKWNLQETIQHTIEWYKDFSNGEDPIALCHKQIDIYESVL